MIDKLGPYELGRVHHADCLEAMRRLPDVCVDSVVTDPPYGLSFMGKDWDHGIPGVAFWAEAIRVAKPGAHLLAFGGTRTFHRLACAIEDAGWEIRDCLSWLYGQGFPKSLDVQHAINKAARGCPQGSADPSSPNHGKFKGGCCEESPDGRGFGAGAGAFMREQGAASGDNDGPWKGWGTALKPAWEPIIVARKPLVGTVAANVQRHGTGAINVDGCRIGTSDNLNGGAYCGDERQRAERTNTDSTPGAVPLSRLNRGVGAFAQPSGRWPANLVLDEEAAGMLDEQSGDCRGNVSNPCVADESTAVTTFGTMRANRGVRGYADTGGASRFFYCAKASRSERGEGNRHPTVKPLSLMRWLCRLVTPPRGVVLDPFSGSGTTGCAARLEGFRFIGFDTEAGYVEIANARIAASSERLGEVAPSQAKPGQQIELLPTVG